MKCEQVLVVIDDRRCGRPLAGQAACRPLPSVCRGGDQAAGHHAQAYGNSAADGLRNGTLDGSKHRPRRVAARWAVGLCGGIGGRRGASRHDRTQVQAAPASWRRRRAKSRAACTAPHGARPCSKRLSVSSSSPKCLPTWNASTASSLNCGVRQTSSMFVKTPTFCGLDMPPTSDHDYEKAKETIVKPANNRLLTTLALVNALFSCSRALADDPVKQRLPAPADYQIVSSDRAGAYFVARPLKDRYDQLVGQLSILRRDIAEARITSGEARQRVDRLSTELQAIKQQIETDKIYIPGAAVHQSKITESFPLAADDFLLIDAANVELRGWDKSEVRCVVENTILSPDGKGVDDDLSGNQRGPSQGLGQRTLRLLPKHCRPAQVEKRVGPVPVQRVPRP